MIFFLEATLRICSSLEIDKALWECLLFIRWVIPADQVSLHVYDRHQGILETVGKVEGKGGAVELLDVNPRTLRNRMAKLGIAFGRKAKGK